MSLNKFDHLEWTREPEASVIRRERIEITTRPYTDL